MSEKKKKTGKLYSFWLTRKKNEFAKLGYNTVTLDEIWNYFDKYLWKKEKPKYFFEKVRDIMALTPNEYFNYATLKAQVYDVKALNEYDMKDVTDLF